MAQISAVIKWASNIEELRKEFQSGADQLVVLEKAAERTQRNLGGEGLMRAAHNAAAAVQNLGGVTKLTASEQDKINNLLGRAIEKYTALGQVAPTAIKQLYDETKRVATVTEELPNKTNQWTSALKGLGSALGVTLSVGTVIAFGKEILRTGDEIQKMADKTGLTAEQVQKLDYVASQSGTTIDAMVGAVQNLQQRLGDNDTGAVGALGKLGINLQEFLQLNPHDQIQRISEALGKVGDRSQFAAMGADIFGKSWKEIAPAILADMQKLENEAPVIADRTVKSLDAAGDALDRFWRMVKSNAANQIGFFIAAFEQAPKAAHNAFALIGMDTTELVRQVKDLAGWWDVLVQHVEKPPTVGISQSVQNLFSGTSLPKIRLSPDDIAGIEADLNNERKALDEASKAADAHARAIKALSDAYSGTNAIKAANDALQAVSLNLRQGITIAQMSREQQAALNKTLLAGIEVFKLQGKVAPQAMRDLYIATIQLPPVVEGLANGFDHFGDEVKLSIPSIRTVLDLLPKVENGIGDLLATLPKLDLKYQFAQATPEVINLDEELGRFQAHLSQLASVASGTFGQMISLIQTEIGAFREASQAAGELKDGIKDYKEGSTFQGILGIASGLTGLIASAIQAGKALFDIFDRNKGRDAVVEFAKSFGGFDALHEKLLTLGEAGEALWIKLTQGVGRNNPEQAARVIDEVTRALDKQTDQQGEATAATEEQAQATIETATQAAAALEELGGKIKTNEDEWAEWSKEVTGDIDKIAQALRTLTLPSPSGGAPSVPGESSDVSTGGFVTPHGVVRYAAKGMFIPHGTDTQPAMLTPGEGVLNTSAMALLGRASFNQLNTGSLPSSLLAGAASMMYSETTLIVDGRRLGRVLVPHVPNEARRLGVKVRA